MKNTIKYKHGPADIENALGIAEPIADFLPPPEKLVEKIEKEKVTISLNKRSVDFFKRAAKREGVPYQTMINSLLDKYVKRYI